jgi:uncharacterized membrane protein
MNFQFTNPMWLLALPPALAWVVWLAWKSDVQTSRWRRWVSGLIRVVVVTLLVLAVAGIQWLKALEGMNVYFALDRSDSVPAAQQEAARKYVNEAFGRKKAPDKGGVLVFGTESSIESSPNSALDLQKIQAVVGAERSDIAGAIRLGTAAFPENGQKRLVILSDGNENIGDSLAAVLAAKPLGVTVDVVPLGVSRGQDVSVQKLSLPNTLKKGQTFEVKIFIQSDANQPATLRLYRKDQYLGEQKVELTTGKNLFTFPQTLTEPDFYSYNVQVEAAGDMVPQNNRATSFTSVRGEPRVLVVSDEPAQNATLVAALQSAQLEVRSVGITGFPPSLAEMQSYDAIFLSNVAAGDLGVDVLRLLESAVRDFGVGLVCIGGDQTYAAGGYRGTSLEATLPVDMELDSKKVLPKGALALVMHGMEFNNGNQVSRDIAIAALKSLGPQDELGVLLWDGRERWLFPLTPVGDTIELGRKIAGLSQGDLPSFQGLMTLAHQGLVASTANLKHLIVFSDGDPAPPTQQLMNDLVKDRITVSTIMIGAHVAPGTMTWMADNGRGRFYDVQSASQLPQIFIKEAAVILKSAIFEEPFKPQYVQASELVRGIGASEYPILRGYVCARAKPRAEVPLVSDKGDPILAHWQYGLGRAVAFTSDAKAKWGKDWLGWDRYKQFWTQTAKWSLRRLDNPDFSTEVTVDKGEGVVSVEALDAQGNFRNFVNLDAVVVSPRGERQVVRLEQTGPGHYEARFPTKEIGAYVMNLTEKKDGVVKGTQVVGASVNYSPEFNAPEPNFNLLRRLAEAGGGKVLSMTEFAVSNPFLHDRTKTFQPRDLWEWLIKLAIILFALDVGVRRIQIDREEWLRATENLRRTLFFWRKLERKPEADESLAALLARREQVRSTQTAPAPTVPNPDLFRPQQPAVEKPFFAPEALEQAKAEPSAPAAGTPAPAKPGEPTTTTSRLLDAKRKAQRKGPEDKK